MKLVSSISALVIANLLHNSMGFEYAQSCSANPDCAARGLADNCCPTNLAGIFLDCCEEPQRSCDANAGCRGLADDCCPTADGTFLYCCFEDPDTTDAGYKVRTMDKLRA